MSRLSVVIAAYDEEGNVEPLTRRLAKSLSTLAGWTWEIVYVVEGTDRTREILESLSAEIPGLRILYQEKPSGIGNAFRRGFAAIGEDTGWVVTLDADLNHQPEEIPRLLEAARRRGCDVLVGSRFLDESAVEGTPLWKRFLSGTMNHLMRFLYGLRLRDKTSGLPRLPGRGPARDRLREQRLRLPAGDPDPRPPCRLRPRRRAHPLHLPQGRTLEDGHRVDHSQLPQAAPAAAALEAGVSLISVFSFGGRGRPAAGSAGRTRRS